MKLNPQLAGGELADCFKMGVGFCTEEKSSQFMQINFYFSAKDITSLQMQCPFMLIKCFISF